MLRPVYHVELAEQLANEALIAATPTDETSQVDHERAKVLVSLAVFHRDLADMMLDRDIPFHGAQSPVADDDGQD
jgi:hypothetical protein